MSGSKNTPDSELLEKARSFLSSPEISSADAQAKRNFLRSKGLVDDQINQLLSANLDSPPPLPPRTYPRHAPSRLPDIIAAVTRLSAIIMGVAGATTILYYLFILPRLSRTLKARHSLKLDQLKRLSQISSSVDKAEASIVDSAHSIEFQSPLPSVDLQNFKSVEENQVLNYRGLIRAILRSSEGSLTALEIIAKAKEHCPESLDDFELEKSIRRELSRKQFFECCDPEFDSAEVEVEESISESTYSIARAADDSEKLNNALDRLVTATSTHAEILSESSPLSNSSAQKTLQSLSELTALVSSHTYAIPSTFRGLLNNRPQNTLGPAEEEVRRELRALKGLLLNRRTFASLNSTKSLGMPLASG